MKPDNVLFWNDRAPRFPGGREAAHRDRMLARLAHLPDPARPRAGMRCLDIGAGTGVFALYAADLGAQVVATDVSAEMLARLRADDTQGRVETVQEDWQDTDPAARGWSGAFDLVMAQMVPAVGGLDALRRMQDCARGWCVHIGWGRRRDDPWLQEVFAAHGATLSIPPGSVQVHDALRSLGHDLTPIWIDETWFPIRAVDQAIADAASHLQMRGITPDLDRIQAAAKAMAQDGIIRAPARVEIGLLFWHAQGRGGLV